MHLFIQQTGFESPSHEYFVRLPEGMTRQDISDAELVNRCDDRSPDLSHEYSADYRPRNFGGYVHWTTDTCAIVHVSVD